MFVYFFIFKDFDYSYYSEYFIFKYSIFKKNNNNNNNK